MSEETGSINCSRCGNMFQGDFCSSCGKAKSLRRIDGGYILSEIASVFNFDKGLLLTIRELLLRPGMSVKKFILEDRNRLVKPLVFIIICSLVYTLLQQFFNFEDGYVNYSFEEGTTSTSQRMFDWLTKNYGYANILISLFIALWIKILFRKHPYNFFEILILLCFIIGTSMLLFSFFGVLDSLTGLPIVDKGMLVGVLYVSWGIGQFFQGNTWLNSLKGFFCYMLGLLTFVIFILILGLLIDGVFAQ